MPLFEAVKSEYPDLFKGNEEITLSDRALAFIVSELSRYDFARTDVDAKGAAYQEIVGTNLRGDRGQYFTPRGAIRLVVQMLAPKESERVLDSSCGTGGFLVETLNYLNKVFHDEKRVKAGDEEHRGVHLHPRPPGQISPPTSSSVPTSIPSSFVPRR